MRTLTRINLFPNQLVWIKFTRDSFEAIQVIFLYGQLNSPP